MKLAHVQTSPHDDERKIWRAKNFDLCIGRLNVPLMNEANPKCELYDYIQPTVETSWTSRVRGGEDLASGIDSQLHSVTGSGFGVEGVLLDTPLDGCEQPWHGVDVCAGLKYYFDDLEHTPRNVIYNAGDFDSWQGRTPQWKAMYDLFDWHMVEVWLDINNYTVQKLSRRTQAVTEAVAKRKNLIIGIYDEGMRNPEKAAQMILYNPWGDAVYWLYKISPTEWTLCPGTERTI